MTSTKPLPLGSASDLGFCPQRTLRLLEVLQGEVGKARLPGAVALIARRGQVLLHETVGQQDPSNNVPMGLDAIFRIYSMTKPIVSVAAMVLMERGQLLLSDPVAQHLPEFEDIQVTTHIGGHSAQHRPRQAPTVQDLLRHTAGLTYEILGSEPIQRQYSQLSCRKTSSARWAWWTPALLCHPRNTTALPSRLKKTRTVASPCA